MNHAEDVEVILGYERRYKFHSATLVRNSTLLADMLTEANAAKLSPRAKNAGIKTRWMIELTILPNDNYPVGRLELIPLNSTGERSDGGHGLIVNENGLIPQADKWFGHYEAIFYAFYNRDLEIDESDMSAVLDDCVKLIEISDYLGCTRMISKPIEVALLKHGQDLFVAIQNNPSIWITMSDRIQSEAIFKECFIHLVGNWRTLQSKPGVNEHLEDLPGLRELVEDYHQQLLGKCKALETAVFSLYPGEMKTPVEDRPIKREAYARDILVWMALTIFRQWFGQNLAQDNGRHSADGGFKLYTQLGAGGDAYLNRAVLNQFHAKFPLTKKALYVVENHLLEIKTFVKEYVDKKEILKANCQLDTHRFPVKYLTCTDFKRFDYPWTNDYAASRGLSKQPDYKPGGNDIIKENHHKARLSQKRNLGLENVKDEEEERLESDSEAGSDSKRARLE